MKNKNLFNKFFLSYLFVFLVPIISLGILSYWWAGTILTKQTEQSYIAMVKEMSKSIDQKFNELSDLSIQLSYTPWVKKVMYMEGKAFDYSRMNKIELNNHVMELKGYDVINDFIDTIALVFPKQEFVISSSGIENAEVYFNDIYSLEDYKYREMDELFQAYGIKKILNSTTLNFNGVKDNVFTYVQSLPSIDQKPHAFFVSFIKEKEMNDRLKGFQISNDSSIYVLDKNDNLITGLNKEKEFLATIVKENSQTINNNKDHNILSDKQKIYSLKTTNRFGHLAEIKGKKYFVFYQESSVNQWKYIMTIPYNVVMADINHMKMITIVVAILISIIGLFLSYLFTNRNYKPVNNLVNIMKERFSYKEAVNSNEYDFLKQSIFLLLSEEDLLRKQAEKQKPFLRNAALMQIINGDIQDDKKFMELLNSADIRLPYSKFVTVVFVLDAIKGIHSELSLQIFKKMEQFNAKIYFVEINGTKKAAVLNIDNGDKVKAAVILLKQIVEKELHIKSNVAVGKTYELINGIRISYEEGCSALDYKVIDNKNDIIFYEEISDINATYYYPIEKEVEILNALRRGKYSETVQVIEEVIAKNVEATNMCLDNGRFLFYNLISTVLKAVNDLKLNDLIIIDKKYIMNIQTIVKLENYLKDLCKKICDEIEENKTSHNDILKINILKYIDDNFNNPTISLDIVAQSVSKSVPYVSKFFKEQIGCNFLDYLNRKRIAKAKELLNGQMTIIQISELVGYNSDVTFRRVFKKYEGITPSEYIIARE